MLLFQTILKVRSVFSTLWKETQYLFKCHSVNVAFKTQTQILTSFSVVLVAKSCPTLLQTPWTGFQDGAGSKELACQFRRHRRWGFDPWVEMICWRRKWQPIPLFLPGESHGQRSLAGCSPRGHRESDTTEVTYTHTDWTRGLNQYLLPWQADSLPWSYPRKPQVFFRTVSCFYDVSGFGNLIWASISKWRTVHSSKVVIISPQWLL